MSIAENLANVMDRIERAAERSGRQADDITLVAVTKTVPVEIIQKAIDAGVRHIGENRVQEAESKKALISPDVQWHLIGHLQRNKVKSAISLFDMIHSLDSLRLLDAVESHAARADRQVVALIQVNTSGEETKFGVHPDDVRLLVDKANECEHIQLRGLMTIGPLVGGLDAARASFRQLREIRDRLGCCSDLRMDFLSMGMTGDFEVAIEEGADIVRIGTAIFGRRGR